MNQLKPGEITKREFRHTIKEAIKAIPKVENPQEVKEVIFQVGLNDFRKGFSAKEIQENMLEMQIKYKEHFPNARQHVTAIPPLANGHREVNRQLQKLSAHTQTNFISTKSFLDHATGKLRSNVTHGIHYNEWGIRMLAREIKKSLFSNANINNDQLNMIKNLSTNSPAEPIQVPQPAPTQTAISMNHTETHELLSEPTQTHAAKGPYTEPIHETEKEPEWQSWLL